MTAHVPKATLPTARPEIPLIAMAAKGTKKQIPKDKDYIPWKPRDMSESPIPQYTVDEEGHEILNKSDDALPGQTQEGIKNLGQGWAKKEKKKTHAKHSKMTTSAETMNVDISSEDKSNGQGALRAVEEAEEQLRCTSKTQSVPRADGCTDFDDEKPQPHLGNLSTHSQQTHANKWEIVMSQLQVAFFRK
ncbi:hypothetical protein BDR06DRAFT_970806 [Suillus hirtellus]|nr:hypothetical protein BDR06DRAFT_970806 [Suillus hirtellus]